jgi:cytochrome c biogenesis protein CcmG/thiol:disulfide interchange protein DsbE
VKLRQYPRPDHVGQNHPERQIIVAAAEDTARVGRRRVAVLVPLALFLGLALLFAIRLYSGDPATIPSALIGHPAPPTSLPPVAGLARDGMPVPGLDPAAFRGEVSVLNVWASWCVPCHDEAPLLLRLAQDKRIRIVGINYKDQPENARRFLGRYGDPYAANGADENGRAAIEWGVYGVPETFVVGRDARIAFKLIGPITPDNLDAVLKPEIEKAVAAGG